MDNRHTLKTTLLTALSSCCAMLSVASTPTEPSHYQANIRYTEYGVPHISAENYSSLGYGVGLAQATDNLCTLLEQTRNVQSQKSHYLGSGQQQQNLLSDIGYQALGLMDEANQQWPKISPQARQLIQGYVDGFNAHLATLESPQQYPSPCRGVDWVKPITTQQLMAYQLELALLASGRNFLSAIAAAHPPTAANKQANKQANFKPQLNAEQVLTSEGIGSNGWALGKDRVAGANSALLANPHFPWDSELRFYQQHLTIPGELDVTGVGMIGMPGVSIGFNANLGWTHTVSQSKRFTFYQLELDPNNPMRYRYGKEYKDIRSQVINVDVKQADGSIKPYQHTLYFSHYGPILNLESLSPQLGWNHKTALTYRDANTGNSGMLDSWIAMGKAANADEFFQAVGKYQSIPWVNTIMVDRFGQAGYLDATQVPNLSAKAEAYWRAALKKPAMAALWRDGAGSLLLPGSDPAFEWQVEAGARMDGLVPFSRAPQLRRSDYVFNSNSSHWLSNLKQPLTGFSIAYGPENSHRSPRTRYNATLISAPAETSLAGKDLRFDKTELKQVFTHNRSLFSKQLRSELVQRCQQTPSIRYLGAMVDLSGSCEILANWDGRYNLDSRGAHLMREFLAQFRVKGHRDLDDRLFARHFDSRNPAHTPSGLAPAKAGQTDFALQALAAAAARLQQAGLKADASLGSVQYVVKALGQAVVPVTGGYSYEGIFNFAEARTKGRGHAELARVEVGKPAFAKTASPLRKHQGGLSNIAYPVNFGSSFVLALLFTDQGPEAEMFLSYSQAHDPESAHFRDQSQLFSKLQWRPVWFSDDDIRKHQVSEQNIRVKR